MTELKTGLWTCHCWEISGPGWSVSRPPHLCTVPGGRPLLSLVSGQRPQLLGYHVRSLLIRAPTRSSPRSPINHTTFTPQLWPTLTVNALCKSNQLSGGSPSSEWLKCRKLAADARAINSCFGRSCRSQLKPEASSCARRVNVRVFHKCQLLPAHCLVGELSHSVELLLHLVFFCVTTGR